MNPDNRHKTVTDAESALRESEERTGMILDHALDAVIIMDAAGRISGWNRQAEQIFGWTRDEVLGRPLAQTIIPPQYREAHERGLMRYLATGEGPVLNQRMELTGLRRSGEEFPIELSVTPIRTTGEIGFSAFVRDISERHKVELALRNREAEYRLLFEGNPNPMWVYDSTTLEFLAVNDAAVHQYGYSREELLGMTIRDIRPSEDVSLLLKELTTPSPDSLLPAVWRHQKKDGTLIDVEITARPLVFSGRAARMVLAHDVTRRTRLEEQFRQAQRIEAVGRLAAGIAHDFNNLLSAILGYAEIMAETLPPGDPSRDDAIEIRRVAERAAVLTRQILAFSRQQVLEERVLDLNQVVTGLETLLRRIIGEDIVLSIHLDPALGRVKADAGQLEQVIMNLVVNARDAMPQGGSLTIETRNVEFSKDYIPEHPGSEEGRFVMFSVADTGHGMTREVRAHIFEPFYTTKNPGEGTGLGLSTAYGIIKQSGGYVWVYGESGQGTTFKVYLPRVDEPLDRVAPAIVPAAAAPATETILLVEDDMAVRSVARRLLEREGYAVLEAPSPEEAVAFCVRHPGTIHMILSDIVMPGTNGLDLAKTLTGLRPGTRVLFMSGYAGSSLGHLGSLEEGMAFLEKPFTATGLTRKVRALLDS